MSAVTPPLPAGVQFELDWLRLVSADLNLPFGKLTSGAMRIENLRNGRLNLERLPLPATPAKPTRPGDTALGLRLRSLAGVAGTLAVVDVELTGTATPGGGGSGP